MVLLVDSWLMLRIFFDFTYDTLAMYLFLYTIVYKKENKKVNSNLLNDVTLSVADYRKCLCVINH